MEKKEFLRSIQSCRRRLNTRDFLNKLVSALGIGAVAGILLQGLAFLTPIYYVNLYVLIALFLAIVAAAAVAIMRRNSMKQAALAMDSFGFQERIITAYEHLEEEGSIFRLQREDAMKRLAAQRERIKIPLLTKPKRLFVLAGLFVLLVVLAWLPAPMKDKAKELHEIGQLAKEKAEEIEEVAEALEKLEADAVEQEILTPEQLAALQDMMESLQNSMEELKQANTMDGLAAAGEKLEYKYENMSNQLNALASTLQSGATASTLTAEDMQELASNLQEMSGSAADGNQLASNNGQSGDGNQSGQGNQPGDGQGNQPGDGQGNQPGDGQDGGDGNGTGDGNGSGSGNGNGSGNGQNGQGSNGNGTGNGSGNGRGTGSANIPRDYVSIPNAIANNENLTGNASNHDASQYFKTQNGLSWEGERISYESVIGSYEQNAYEGIAADRYPSGMEDVIKDYFSSFN